MRLQGKRIALLMDEGYQELEGWYPYYRLKEEGATVEVVAAEAGKSYPSKLGYPFESTLSAREAMGQTWDALIAPGGWCADFMRRHASMVEFTQKCAADGITLAAICHGVWMLCCTDALRGRRATSFMAIEWDVRNAGAEWVDEEVVVDGNVITSRKPDDLPAFCGAIIAALAGRG